MDRRQRRVFPEAFKREAVERVRTSGLSVGAVAVELGLHDTVLRKWVRQLGATQAMGPARRPNTQAPPRRRRIWPLRTPDYGARTTGS